MTPDARDRRKADLIAASALLRPHAAGAVHELADFADTLGHRIDQVRTWVTHPLVQRAGTVLGLLLAVRRLLRRRAPAPRPRRFAAAGSLATVWRLARLASPWIVAWVSRRA